MPVCLCICICTSILLDAANPDVYWWMKGDGCDLVAGLSESVAGDVDLNTGDLQRCYELYKSKLALISGLGLGNRRSRIVMRDDLNKVCTQLKNDKEYNCR